MNTKVVIPVIIVIIAVAAVGGYFLLSDSGDQGDEPVDVTNRLMIFGNANCDDYLDDRDVKTLEKIVSDIADGGTWDKSANFYADANQDGKITQADVDWVKKMVAKEPMEVYFMDANMEVVRVDYPVMNVAAITTVTFDPLTILDVHDKVVARHGTKGSFDQVRHQFYEGLPPVGIDTRSKTCITIPLLSEAAASVEGGIDAIVTRSDRVEPEMEQQLRNIDDGRPNGISVLRMGFGSIETEAAAYLTLGWLMEAEEAAEKYVKFIDGLSDEVDEIVAKVPKDKRPEVLCSGGMGNAILIETYEDCQWSTKAGAINKGTAANLGQDDSKYIQVGDVWQYDSKFDADWLIYTSGMNFDKTKDNYVDAYNDRLKPHFGEHDCFPEKTVILSTHMPSIVGSLYFCELFYPDYTKAGYASEKLQEYIDDYLNITGYKVSDHPFLYTYEDVKDAL